MGIFDALPTLAEVAADRKGPLLKGESRLQKAAREDKDEAKLERDWHRGIDKRDKGICRWCGRKTVKTLDRVPERREHHHVSGRIVAAIRWLVKNGLTLCCTCHERVTGRVNERFVIVPKKTFVVDGIAYADADKPVKFTRIA